MDINLKVLKTQNKKLLAGIVLGFVIFTPMVILFISILDEAEAITLHNTINTIIFSTILWLLLFVAIQLRSLKLLSMASAIIMAIYPLLLIYFEYFNSTKTNLRINYLVYLILLLYSVFNLVKYYIAQKNIYLANIASVLILPTLSLLLHSKKIRNHVYVFNDTYHNAILLFAISITIVSIVVFFVKNQRLKQRMSKRQAKIIKNKKEKTIVSNLISTICCAFLLSYLFSSTLIKTTNYIFDNSQGTEITYTIIEKDRVKTGRYSRGYEFVIINDDKEHILVSAKTYEHYSINDSIILIRHVGALGIEYYEYIDKVE